MYVFGEIKKLIPGLYRNIFWLWYTYLGFTPEHPSVKCSDCLFVTFLVLIHSKASQVCDSRGRGSATFTIVAGTNYLRYLLFGVVTGQRLWVLFEIRDDGDTLSFILYVFLNALWWFGNDREVREADEANRKKKTHIKIYNYWMAVSLQTKY